MAELRLGAKWKAKEKERVECLMNRKPFINERPRFGLVRLIKITSYDCNIDDLDIVECISRVINIPVQNSMSCRLVFAPPECL